MPYSIALFDADNTLFDFTRSEHEAVCECLRVRGLPHDPTVAARYSAINDGQWKRLEMGMTTRDQLKVERFRILFEELGSTLDPRDMARDYEVTLSGKSYLLDGAEELIRGLHGRCRLFIITNGTAVVQRGRMAACPLRDCFEDVFISEDVGYAKPSPEYFARVAAAIPGFVREEALIIGDSLTSDIQGGILSGIDTCWFDPAGRSLPPGMTVNYIVDRLSAIPPILLGEEP